MTRRYSVNAFLAAASLTLSASAWADCPPGMVPRGVYSQECYYSGSSSSGGSGSEVAPLALGGMTQRTFGNTAARLRDCGSNPFCVMMGIAAGCIVVPIGMMLDAPYYAVKGVGYGLYYGAVGIGGGMAATGRGIASAFRADPAKLAAAAAPASCSGETETFSEYRAWEACKKRILKRQKTLTKQSATNAENEKWCKGHVPLGASEQRVDWISRCNPSGSVAAGAGPAATPPTATAPATTAPATGNAGATASGTSTGGAPSTGEISQAGEASSSGAAPAQAGGGSGAAPGPAAQNAGAPAGAGAGGDSGSQGAADQSGGTAATQQSAQQKPPSAIPGVVRPVDDDLQIGRAHV